MSKYTLLLNLTGPMQSWGTCSQFNQRDSGREPSKSGIFGIIATALGIDRGDRHDLKSLTTLKMAVRHERPGILKKDYQTAGEGGIKRFDGTLETMDKIVSSRMYLADATFLVALENKDVGLLEKIQQALKNPKWFLSLGRRSYVPSKPIWIENGLVDSPLRPTIDRWPWMCNLRKWEKEPEKLLLSYESENNTGTMRMDQLLSSFSERKFGRRYVKKEWIPFPKNGDTLCT